jgi:glutaredoxin
MTLTLYSRPGCHLCEEMMAAIRTALQGVEAPIELEEIDISTDPQLEARYGLEIPVLLIDGAKVAKYRIGEADLRRVLAHRLTDRPGRQGGTGGSERTGGT